jgi:hypothetical protein
MKDPVESFLCQVRQLPKFVEAARADEKWLEHFEQLETGLYGFADSDEPRGIEAFDEILRVIGRQDRSLKNRLLEIVRIATAARDNGRSIQ